MLCLVFSVISNFCLLSLSNHTIQGIKILAIKLLKQNKIVNIIGQSHKRKLLLKTDENQFFCLERVKLFYLHATCIEWPSMDGIPANPYFIQVRSTENMGKKLQDFLCCLIQGVANYWVQFIENIAPLPQ